jgi:tRNA pseudouridine65 synthase
MEKVQICYMDDHFVVVNKPPGMLVHKTNMDINVKVTLMQILGEQLGRKVYPVHRLDKGTSGTNIFSFDAQTSDYFRRAFIEKRVEKIYYAICRGWLDREVLVDHPVYTSTLRNKAEAVTRITPLSHAEIDVPVGPYEKSRYTLVQAEPQTGRWHQIRQHCSHLRHPIIKDSRHGDYRHNRMFQERYGVETVLLHAGSITFDHPDALVSVCASAVIPDFWKPVLEEMNWRNLPELEPFL